jgi:predicted lipid-binding transport protein (Tim44 family)
LNRIFVRSPGKEHPMKIQGTLALLALAFAAMVAHDVADARVGGGRSMGAQRPSVTPRAQAPQAAPAPQAPTPSGAASNPVMPAAPGATLPARPATPAAAAPASGASRWLGPIAGIAAGLGLAALLSHFGLPEGLGTFLLLGLLAVGVVFLVRMMFARRQPPEAVAYAGSGRPGTTPTFDKSSLPDAAGGSQRIEPVLGSAGVAPAFGKAFPPGFDAVAFARHAKEQFIALQAAHDAGDRAALRDVLTPEMYAEVLRDLETGPRPSTEVVNLDAEVLEVVTEGDRHWASVRFTGRLREGGGMPQAFDEVWNLSKPVDGKTGWMLAGIQQYA